MVTEIVVMYLILRLFYKELIKYTFKSYLKNFDPVRGISFFFFIFFQIFIFFKKFLFVLSIFKPSPYFKQTGEHLYQMDLE